MPEVRRLKNPPITEGLIDLRVDECRFSRDKLDAIADSVKADYPRRREQREFQTRLEATGSGAVPRAQTRDLGLRGWQFASPDKRQVVQFRSDGFTLNRLSPYTGWDAVFLEAMKLWRLFVEVLEPEAVTRVAVRYINHIPLKGGRVDLGDYLRAPVPLPPELNQLLTSLLTSVVIKDPESPSIVKITQSFQPTPSEHDSVLLYDVDASQQAHWAPTDSGIEKAFTQLRSLKNKAFFNGLTDALLASFE